MHKYVLFGMDYDNERQYKKLSYTSSEFELRTLNDNWPNIAVNENGQAEIIGKVVQVTRVYYA